MTSAFIRVARVGRVGQLAALTAALAVAPHLRASAEGVVGMSAGWANAEWARPWYAPVYGMPYAPFFYPVPCGVYGACAWLWWDGRWRARRPIAPDQPPPMDQDIWGTTGSPWGYVRRLPPPTPESHIQPLYREASLVRPEFDDAGTIRPGFAARDAAR